MAVVQDARASTPPEPHVDARALATPGVGERIAGASVPIHAAALGVVLLLVVAVVGTGASYSADEGAAIIQAQSLADGDGWIVEHPILAADPDQVDYPLELSEWGEKGTAPYAKHPTYPLLLAAASRLGGVTAMVLLSAAGTLVAALLTGRLARRLDPGLERPALWATGIASPLLFDGTLVIAHTLGAAGGAAAALAALKATDRPGPSRWGWAAVAAASAAGAALLRTEAALLAAALAAALAVVALRRRAARSDGPRDLRRARATCLVTAALLVGAGAAAVLGDRAWRRSIIGAAVGDPSARGGDGAGDTLPFLAARVEGFVNTWLTPALDLSSGLLLLAGLALAGAVVAVRRGAPQPTVSILALAGAGFVVARVVVAEPAPVPGLLLAFPLLWVGLAAGGRRAWAGTDAAVLAVTAALFAAAVLATQYPEGGSAEWGGRYFAVGLPLAVPLALRGLAVARGRLDAEVRRRVMAALLVVSVGLAVLAVAEVRRVHTIAADIMGAADLTARATIPGDGGTPVIVADAPLLPRLAWATFDNQRWLLADPDRSADRDLVARLRAAGIERFVYVTPGEPEGGLVAGAERSALTVVHGWWIQSLAVP